MIHVAAITPRGRQGDIDFGAAFELVDNLCACRAGGIALMTAAGEYAAFSADDRSRLVYLVVKRSRVPVMAGVGADSLDLALDLAREARQAGAAALLLPPPHFFHYRQDDLREFYLEFSRHFGDGVPVYIANTPPFTSTIETETALDLLADGSFDGIMSSAGFDTIRAAGHTALGDDASCEQALAAEAPVISAAACAAPKLVLALERALAGNCRDEAARLGAQFRELLGYIAEFPFPMLLKAAVAWRGLKAGPPAVPLPSEKQQRLDEIRERFRAWDR